MMSDAPAHHIFCLLGPVDPNSKSLPEVLCVIQVIVRLVILNILRIMLLMQRFFVSGLLGRTDPRIIRG